MPDPFPPTPRIESFGGVVAGAARVVLLLHGGEADSLRPARRGLAYVRMLPFARAVGTPGTAVYLLRYRYRGWNGTAADARADAEWGLTEIAARHPGARVALLGHSMGARAALGAAGGPDVVAVCALAPWLGAADPVDQLAGRSVLIAHGDRERTTDPAESFAYAVRAKAVTDRVCRFEVLGDGHAMLRRARDWTSIARRFVLGELGVEPEDPEIAAAMRQPAPAGLRLPLARAAT